MSRSGKSRLKGGEVGLDLLRKPTKSFHFPLMQLIQVKADIHITVGSVITPDTTAEQIYIWKVWPLAGNKFGISFQSRPSPARVRGLRACLCVCRKCGHLRMRPMRRIFLPGLCLGPHQQTQPARGHFHKVGAARRRIMLTV
jgi:hypothetical protein